MINIGDEDLRIERGMRIEKEVLDKVIKKKIEEREKISEKERGEGGLG